MYLNHYGLKDQPFSISPDYRFLWLSEKHSEALATLKYGIMENKGFLLLTGDVGTGKTVLLNRLIQDLEPSTRVASITDPGLSAPDFFNLIAAEFNMNKKFTSKGEFLIQFKRFLLKTHGEKNKLLLIIDEAQRLSHELLEQIRLLSNIELHNRKLINIFFVGQSEFNEMLLEERNRAVRQRITLKFNIDPLTETETEHYIKHRLKIAGATTKIFAPEAIREIYSYTQGYPRLINITCDHALLSGYASSLKLIDRHVVEESIKELKIKSDADPNISNSREYISVPAQQVLRIEQEKPLPEKPLMDKKMGIIITLVIVILILISSVSFYPKQMVRNDAASTAAEIVPQAQDEPLPPKYQAAAAVDEKVNQEAKKQEVTKANFVTQEERIKITKPLTEPHAQNHEAADGIFTLKPTASIAENSPGTEKNRKDTELLIDENMIIIYFKYNSNEILGHEFGKIDHMAKLFSYYPKTKILIEGYTDSNGNYDYNQKLSKFRAEVVKNYLVDKGIADDRIEVFGRGSSNPIKSNDTIDGRKKNRRVEVKLIAADTN